MLPLKSSRDTTIGALGSLGGLVGWSIAPVFIKYLTDYFDSWTQNFYRYLVACLVCAPLLLAAKRRGRLHPDVWRAALYPAIPNVIMQCFWAAGFYYVNPGFGTLLAQSSILWTAVFAMTAFPEERGLLRSPALWGGLLLSGVGVAGVILARPDFAARGTLAGILIVLSSSFFWAAYTVTARGAFRNIPSQQGFAVMCLYTTVGLGLIGLVVSRQVVHPPRIPSAWVAIVVSGIVSIALAHIVYYVAQKRVGATIPALILLLVPFSTLALSWAVFGERLLPAQWGWGIVSIAGSGLFVLAHRHITGR